MACDGGNDYKQAHNGGKKRQKSTGSAVDLSVNVDDYDRCYELVAGIVVVVELFRDIDLSMAC